MRMREIYRRARALSWDERGLSMLEYALVVGLVGVVVLSVAIEIGDTVDELFSLASDEMVSDDSVASGEGNGAGNGEGEGDGGGETDTDPPDILSAGSDTPSGTLGQGDEIRLVLSYDEPVVVTGAPEVPLTIGQDETTLVYSPADSGGSTVVFKHVVQPGDFVTAGDVFTGGTVDLAGGTMADAAGNPAELSFDPVTISTVTIACVAPHGTVIWDDAGSYVWKVPCGITSIAIELWGSGAPGSGGGGGGGGGAGASLGGGHVGGAGGFPSNNSQGSSVDNLDGATPLVSAGQGDRPTDGGNGGGHGTLGYFNCQQGGGGFGGSGGQSLSGDGAPGIAGTAGQNGTCRGPGGFGGIGGAGGAGLGGVQSTLVPLFSAGAGGNGGHGGNGGQGGTGTGSAIGGGGGGGGGGGTGGGNGQHRLYNFGNSQGVVDPYDRIQINVGASVIPGGAGGGGAGGTGGNPGQAGTAGTPGTYGQDGAVIISY
jgi:Flp pilus assembly pilin Flp